MDIQYVTCKHAWPKKDELGHANVVTHEELDLGVVAEYKGRVDKHGKWLDEHRDSIESIPQKTKQNCDDILKHADRIGCVEEQVNKMPQTMRETLDQLLREMLADKLEMGAKVVEGLQKEAENLRKERDAVFAQLAELKRQREEMKTELETMRNLCAEAKKTFEEQLKGLEGRLADVESIGQEMNDDFSRQVAEFKLSVPVPKKFAKFLFVQPEVSPEKKG